MKDYQAYLFDFDGTLFDTYESLTYVYHYAFEKIGYDCTREQVAVFMHMSLEETLNRLKIMDPAKRQLVLSGVQESIDFPENIDRIEIYPDVIPTLKALHERGKVTAVVSGNNEKHIALILARFHLTSDFAFVVGYSPFRKPKPSGDPIFEARKRLPQFSSDQLVYIGDSIQDPLTAKNGGTAGILLERNAEYPDYPEAKIPSLAALLK
jgi:phosphoglycolate phosphatase